MFASLRKLARSAILTVIATLALKPGTAEEPKFVDLSLDAQEAATQAMAGAIASASAINYAARKANSANGSPVTRCTEAAALLSGGLPANYNLGTVPLLVGANVTINCPVNGPKGTTATAAVTGIL